MTGTARLLGLSWAHGLGAGGVLGSFFQCIGSGGAQSIGDAWMSWQWCATQVADHGICGLM